MTKILLVTNKRDLTTDYIVKEIRKRDLDFIRFNTEDVPSCKVILNESGSIFQFNSEDWSFDLGEISAAYFRRPELPTISEELVDATTVPFALAEWQALLKAMYLHLDRRWLSHPLDIIRSEDKPYQVRAALQVGMLVPPTVVSNDFDIIKRVSESRTSVCKPLRSALVEDGGGGKVVYTSRMGQLNESDRSSVTICPHIYQKEILKKFDIRVTVVGEDVFSVAIDSQRYAESSVDWRRGTNPNLPHVVFALPEKLSLACVKLVKRFGLGFGAIDLIEDRDGCFWFLECNPNGQWAWIENRTGLPISASIVNQLEKISAR